MVDPAPRVRTAAEIADHASSVVNDAQELAEKVRLSGTGSDPATCGELRQVLGLIERLAGQLEDLAVAS